MMGMCTKSEDTVAQAKRLLLGAGKLWEGLREKALGVGSVARDLRLS